MRESKGKQINVIQLCRIDSSSRLSQVEYFNTGCFNLDHVILSLTA